MQFKCLRSIRVESYWVVKLLGFQNLLQSTVSCLYIVGKITLFKKCVLHRYLPIEYFYVAMISNRLLLEYRHINFTVKLLNTY